jgi:hypothetical protein
LLQYAVVPCYKKCVRKKPLLTLHLEEPLNTTMWTRSGVYRINVGTLRYYGSTFCLAQRMNEHRRMLSKGEHPNKLLQDEWDLFGDFSGTLLIELTRKPRESDKDFRQRLRLGEHGLLIEHHGTPGCANVSADAGFNTGISDTMKEKWADPEWGGRMRAKMKEMHRDRVVSAETREKMSIAKKGARNGNSRACTFLFNGKLLRFESAREASFEFKVSQQTVDFWLRGITQQPGSPRSKRSRNPQLAGLVGSFDKPRPEERWLAYQLENAMTDAGLM